ncbi:MAG: hypothetical protein AB8I08_00430 [Sandaracinaceae bacterium]
MRPSKTFATAALVCAAAAMVCARPLSAQRRRARRAPVNVAIGELSGARVPEAFSRAVGEALEAHPEVRLTAPGGADLVVRGSIVSMRRSRIAGDTEIRCEVSMIVADARGGAIRAMLHGRGGARGDGAIDRLSQDALRAAVRGALRPLGQQSRTLARGR